MSVPNWYELVLLGAAAYRTWKLIAEDTITEGLRKRFLGRRAKWGVFVNCPWCAGFWVALAWWGAWQLWPHGTLVAATVFTLSLIVGVLGYVI